ncbi:hypothetical protein BHAMNSH16_07735 [Brachyspira hampsonii]|uniref:Uncharacterized protein n=1 Tax=Brachyspira hampsonii TaxID=1287055 RepID=A0AAC9XK65_9SPIR|nr:hypothetical protein BHAMNSH16_07735 [Brachyspira hampsonii]ELV05766.1 hypothetical protein H263_08379 [Brachyspira hampsonii 30599]
MLFKSQNSMRLKFKVFCFFVTTKEVGVYNFALELKLLLIKKEATTEYCHYLIILALKLNLLFNA